MLFALGTVLVAAQVQTPMGKISRSDMIAVFSDLGYKTGKLQNSGVELLTDGRSTVMLLLQMHGSPTLHVGQALGRIEFDAPKFVEKERLKAWLAKQKLPGVEVQSYLGGRIVLQSYLALRTDTKAEVDRKTKDLFKAVVALKRDLPEVRPSFKPYELGSGPLDLNAKLELVEPQDLDYLRGPLKWGRLVTPGGGKGWGTGAEPKGVPMFSSSALGPGAFLLSFQGKADPKVLSRIQLENITWAQVVIQDGAIYISALVDTKGGKTVRAIAAEVETFANRIKGLGLKGEA